MITILYNWLLASPSKQAPTTEACKRLYSCNPTYKKLLKSIGGIRKLLYHTASIDIVLKQATGGNNFIRVVGVSPVPLFNLDLLGGKYAIGEISFVSNDNDNTKFYLTIGNLRNRHGINLYFQLLLTVNDKFVSFQQILSKLRLHCITTK